MGYLTTITIYNDEADQLKPNAEELAQTLYHASLGVPYRRIESRIKHSLILQKPRHADDRTMYFHSGNTVIDISKIDTADHLMKEDAINHLKQQLERLKKL